MRRASSALRATLPAIAIAAGACFAACGASRTSPPAPPRAAPGSEVRSNVARADYAGSASCASCHGEIHERWSKSPMHRMTRLVAGAEVHAPFDGTVFHFKSDSATLESHGGARYLHLQAVEKGGVSKLFRVTKVIGGRHREDFAGVEVDRAAADAKALGPEKILPVSFVIGTKTLRYKGYSVMEQARPGLRAAGEWRKRCIFCHNTEPYLDQMLGALVDTKPYQGVVVDALLPTAKRATLSITDDRAFRDVLRDEVARLDAPAAARVASASNTSKAIVEAIGAIRAGFDEPHLLEVGIGCESCHGGCREHVEDPRVKPSYAPRAPWLATSLPGAPTGEAARAQAIDRACARCHQVLFSGYPWTWEGGRRAKGAGGSHINSGEARDFLLGGCASKLACTACHDPHAADPEAAMRVLAGEKGNALCTSCHGQYASTEAHRAHAHHDPQGAGGSCIGCHMPRKNMTLDTRLGAYHRIGSPTDAARVERDRPLECALCHATKSVRALVETMESWWGKSYDRKALVALYGDLEGSPILSTLSTGKPHEQAVAIFVAGEARLKPAVPFLARQITHATPLVRYYVVDALGKLLGGPPPIDVHRDDVDVAKATRAWIASKGYALAEP